MTESFNPYTVLGISRGANGVAIKKAYRKKAAAAHPDHGGTSEAFAEVKRAYDILSDPDRRRAYDSHGFTEGKPNLDDPVVHQAMHVLTMELGEMVKTANAIGTLDLLGMMRNKISNGLETCLGHCEKAYTRLRNAKALRERFAAKSGKPNYLGQILDADIRDAEEIIVKQQLMVDGIRLALKMLDDHTYRRDAPTPRDGFGRTYADQRQVEARSFLESAGFMLPGRG